MEMCDVQKTSCVICHDGYNDLVPQEKHYRVHRLLLPCGAQCPLILSGTHMINCYDTRLSAGFVTSTQCVIQPLCPWNAVLRSPYSVVWAFQAGPGSGRAIRVVMNFMPRTVALAPCGSSRSECVDWLSLGFSESVAQRAPVSAMQPRFVRTVCDLGCFGLQCLAV